MRELCYYLKCSLCFLSHFSLLPNTLPIECWGKLVSKGVKSLLVFLMIYWFTEIHWVHHSRNRR